MIKNKLLFDFKILLVEISSNKNPCYYLCLRNSFDSAPFIERLREYLVENISLFTFFFLNIHHPDLIKRHCTLNSHPLEQLHYCLLLPLRFLQRHHTCHHHFPPLLLAPPLLHLRHPQQPLDLDAKLGIVTSR